MAFALAAILESKFCSRSEYSTSYVIAGNVLPIPGYNLQCSLDMVCTYRVEQEECAKLREGVPYVKLYRKNPKHLYPKLNGLGDNGQ